MKKDFEVTWKNWLKKAILPNFIMIIVLVVIDFLFPENQLLFLIGIVVFIISVLWSTYFTNKYYICPKCGKIPYIDNFGRIALYPKQCRHCDEKLLGK